MPMTPYRAGEGEPLVLLHGFTSTWNVWKPVLPALEARHAVLVPSLPGHLGGDPWPEGTDISWEVMADSVEAMLDAAGLERVHLAGNSLGGWVALRLAERGRALSIVALCPAGGWEPDSAQERAIVRYFRRNKALLRFGEQSLRFTASRPRLRRLALRELVARPERVDAAAAFAMFEGALGCEIMGEALNATAEDELFPELGGLSCPVRIAYGTRDRIVRWPQCYSRLRRMLPGAEYVALEGLGHLPMWDDPEVAASTVLEVTAAASPVGT